MAAPTGANESNNTDIIPCVLCPPEGWYDRSLPGCVPKPQDYLDWDHPFTYLCYAASAVGICNVSFIAVVFVIYRNTPIIKAINRPLTCLQLLAQYGVLLLFLFYIGRPNRIQCHLQLILRGPIFSLAACSFVVKTRQVLRIFSSRPSTLGRRRRLPTGHRMQIVIVLLGTFLHVVLLGSYFVVRPTRVLVLEEIHFKKTYVECDFGIYVIIPNNGYVFSLAALCFFLSYRARHVPENFGESRRISQSVGLSLIFWVALMVPFAISNGSLKTMFPVLILFTTAFSIQFLYFIPKCHLVLFQSHRNTKEEMRRLTMNHMKKEVARRMESSTYSPPSSMNGARQEEDVTAVTDVQSEKRLSAISTRIPQFNPKRGYVASRLDIDGRTCSLVELNGGLGLRGTYNVVRDTHSPNDLYTSCVVPGISDSPNGNGSPGINLGNGSLSNDGDSGASCSVTEDKILGFFGPSISVDTSVSKEWCPCSTWPSTGERGGKTTNYSRRKNTSVELYLGEGRMWGNPPDCIHSNVYCN